MNHLHGRPIQAIPVPTIRKEPRTYAHEYATTATRACSNQETKSLRKQGYHGHNFLAINPFGTDSVQRLLPCMWPLSALYPSIMALVGRSTNNSFDGAAPGVRSSRHLPVCLRVRVLYRKHGSAETPRYCTHRFCRQSARLYYYTTSDCGRVSPNTAGLALYSGNCLMVSISLGRMVIERT